MMITGVPPYEVEAVCCMRQLTLIVGCPALLQMKKKDQANYSTVCYPPGERARICLQAVTDPVCSCYPSCMIWIDSTSKGPLPDHVRACMTMKFCNQERNK